MNKIKRLLPAFLLVATVVLLAGTTAHSQARSWWTNVVAGIKSGGDPAPIPLASDGLSVPISGSITATVNTASLATAAKQDTGNTSLGTIATNTTGVATSAKQDTGNTSLGTVATQTTTTATNTGTIATNTGATTTALTLLKQPTQTAAVTISDSTDLTATCTKGLWVGVGGNVAIKGAGDSSAVTIKNVPSGMYLAGALSRVMSTNTTACTSAGDCVCFYGP